MEARQVRVPQQRMQLGRRRLGGSAREPAKSSCPESARAKFERNSVGGSAHGANPFVFRFLSAHQSFVLSFPLFRLSRSEEPPADFLNPHAEGDIRLRSAVRCAGRVSLIARIACPRGCSSAGRAPALQAGGQRFESAHLHQHIDNRIGLSRSPECRNAISGSSFLVDVTLHHLFSD